MSTNINSQQRLQMLQETKARLDAEIASIQASSTRSSGLSYGGSPGHRQHRRHEVPRSLSHSGSSMTRTVSTGQGQRSSVPMSKSVSQHSAPAMARFGSRGSTSSIPSMPFTNTGSIPPPLENRRESSVLDSFMSHQDDPVNAYTFAHQSPLRPSTSQRQPALEQVAELDYGEHPEAFFARTGLGPVVNVTPSPLQITTSGPWQQNPHRLSVSSQRRQSFGIQTPETPSTAALTTATTWASDMSRENSYCSEVLNGGIEMLALGSNGSFFDNSDSYQSYPTLPSSKPFSSEEQSLLLTGMEGANNTSFSLSLQRSNSSAQATYPSVGDMKRSESNESNSSISSSKSRAQARLQSQIQVASSRPIAPKAESEDDSQSLKATTTTQSNKSKNDTDGRVPIAKTPYQRPKHERVFCNQCLDYPEGFRGAHELGRHVDRQHKGVVKKWVCMEPVDGLIYKDYHPVNSLAKCKACSNQRKKYGAYYNAAAHLRRAHFKPKPRGRSKSSKIEDKSEKRGGKGGGDWPPMSELKRWMKEVNVHVSKNEPQDNDEDCEDDCIDYDDMEQYNSVSNLPATTLSYGNGFAYNANTNVNTTMLDSYPHPPPTYNMQSMQSMQGMQFDLLPLQQNIDTSMAYASSQASFDSQLVLMNDPIGSFTNDSFSQSYDLSQTDLLTNPNYNIPIM